jgi:peroxiredoxin
MDSFPTLETNKPAPQFTLFDLNGIEHALAKTRGRIAIINFWSAECPWSERVDRELSPLLCAWRDEVIMYPIASNANEERELLSGVAAARKLEHVLLDEGHLVADLYGAVTTPHIFVIDREGILRYQGAFDDVTFGQREPHVRYVPGAIEAVLSGREPDPDRTLPYGCALVRFAP